MENRLHADVHGAPGRLDALVARLGSLGATRVREFDEGPAGHWWLMRDPEGNEFCAARGGHPGGRPGENRARRDRAAGAVAWHDRTAGAR